MTGAADVGADDGLTAIMESAARLQRLVPDAVLVGGTAAAWHAHHRLSFDHDHVVTDLRDRFDAIFDALSREGDYVHVRDVPGKIVPGSLGGVDVGVRQLVRARPLETEWAELPSGARVRVPTVPEIQRVKAFMILKRNQVRDYLDLAALTDLAGLGPSARNLSQIDRYYESPDRHSSPTPVLDDLIVRLADPRPRDRRTLDGLDRYKGLARRWQDWAAVADQCRDLAVALAETEARG
ncbi:MAG: nucleotidyl transferase AbiEii/AbiGii toxin family protein [Bifidobacteriaceae bacterium]|jgi:hypothetical protein|nr:nucleotidyl transferase AbiEii/AbiGii toxin family protein [Bifidobacteriaceae bacterium]